MRLCTLACNGWLINHLRRSPSAAILTSMTMERELASWPPNLPTIQPNETLYSWCATVHRRQVSGNAIATSRALFGSNHSALLHDFPAHLDELARRTAHGLGTTRSIALRHTLLGYFLAFVDGSRAEKLIQGVLTGAIPDLKMRLGIPASGIGGYHPLRCCKECIERDKEELGWPLWHLRHQAPSTLVCTIHHRPLVQVWRPRSPVHEREWISPCAKPSSDRHEIAVSGEDAMNVLHRLALMSEHAMAHPPGSLRGDTLAGVYRGWARSKDLLTEGGSVRHAQLNDLLRQHFELLRITFSKLEAVPCQLDLRAILGSLVRTQPKPAHPLKHLALLACLFKDPAEIDSALKNAMDVADPSDGAQPAAGRREDAIDQKRLLFLSLASNGSTLRSASIRAGVSVSTGVRWAIRHGIEFTSRAKSIDAHVIATVGRDARLGLDRQHIAENAGISLSTVNRLFSIDHALRDAWQQARRETAKEHHRSQISSAISTAQFCSQIRLRRTHAASWAWLYRNDREWLVAALPALWKTEAHI